MKPGPYIRIFDGEGNDEPQLTDVEWCGRQLERHAHRANRALDQRDDLLIGAFVLCKLAELLELLGRPGAGADGYINGERACMWCHDAPAMMTSSHPLRCADCDAMLRESTEDAP